MIIELRNVSCIPKMLDACSSHSLYWPGCDPISTESTGDCYRSHSLEPHFLFKRGRRKLSTDCQGNYMTPTILRLTSRQTQWQRTLLPKQSTIHTPLKILTLSTLLKNPSPNICNTSKSSRGKSGPAERHEALWNNNWAHIQKKAITTDWQISSSLRLVEEDGWAMWEHIPSMTLAEHLQSKLQIKIFSNYLKLSLFKVWPE